MRKLQNQENVDAPSVNFPGGKIRDNDGTGNGTPVNEALYGDMHQFFDQLMRYVIANKKSGDLFDFNDLPEDFYHGYQLLDALKRFKPYKYYIALITQTGSNDPVVTVLENNIGNIVWSRASAGEYAGTLTNAFTVNKTWAMVDNGAGGTLGARVSNTFSSDVNTIVLRSYNVANAPADDTFLGTAIEIRVYP